MFSFATARSIQFGPGVSNHIAELVKGRRPFVFTGTNPQRYPAYAAISCAPGFQVEGEPTFDQARRAGLLVRDAGADLLIALGGGAVLDLAKAVSVLAAQGTDPLDHAEVIGKGRPIRSRKIELFAIPTTAGTGAEVTANAVLTSVEDRLKVSLRAPAILPDLALVDPALTLTCPPEVTAYSGMDALTQCLEPFTSHAANPLTDGFATQGLLRAKSLPIVFSTPDDLEARQDMALCSLLGGLSLANAKLGAVHGLAGALGGLTGAPHGAICAALLGPTTAMNLSTMIEREPENPSLDRYREAAGLLTGVRHTTALMEWLIELARHLEIPGLGALGFTKEQIAPAVAAGGRSSSMKGNPIKLTDGELTQVLEMAF